MTDVIRKWADGSGSVDAIVVVHVDSPNLVIPTVLAMKKSRRRGLALQVIADCPNCSQKSLKA